jgi:hypothetical protein
MATPAESLTNIAIAELPALIAFLRAKFTSQAPGAPAPTDAEVIAAYLQACASSIATDDNWLAAHPKT